MQDDPMCSPSFLVYCKYTVSAANLQTAVYTAAQGSNADQSSSLVICSSYLQRVRAKSIGGFYLKCCILEGKRGWGSISQAMSDGLRVHGQERRVVHHGYTSRHFVTHQSSSSPSAALKFDPHSITNPVPTVLPPTCTTTTLSPPLFA